MKTSLADLTRRLNPLAWEKTRLVMEVASALKLALEDLGLSQTEMASRLGRSKGIISRQLRGNENLTLGKIAELAFAVGKRLDVTLVDIPNESGLTQQIRWSGRHESPGLRLVWSQKPESIPADRGMAA